MTIALPLVATGGAQALASTPTVTSITPASTTTAGGTVVRVNGSGFKTGATVLFGSAKGTRVAVSSGSALTVHAPKHATGTVNVRVTISGRQSATSTRNRFTYYAPPAVTKVSSRAGGEAGGTSVTVTGTNFRSVTSVLFGTTKATKVKVKNTTMLTATSPKHAAGVLSVRVVGRYGTSVAGRSASFTYVPAPPAASVVHEVPSVGSFGIYGVDCPSSGDCLAVNNDQWRRFNGSAWSARTVLPVDVTPGSVGCLDATHCVVIGARNDGTLHSSTLAGLTWSSSVALLPGIDWLDTGAALTCGPASCLVTASVEDGDSQRQVAAGFTLGHGWTALPAPPFQPSATACLPGGSCRITGTVYGDGDGTPNQYLTSVLTGTTWSAPAATPIGISRLACPTAVCIGAGDVYDDATSTTQAEWTRFDGTTWTAPQSISGADTSTGVLECASTTECLGQVQATSTNGATYTVHFNGTNWSSAPTPRYGGDPSIDILACHSSDSCVGVFDDAVGLYRGGSWAAVPSFPGTSVDVSCPTTTTCLAVDNLGFARRWNGSTWTVVAGASGLVAATAVRCASTSSCVAVGTGADGGGAVARWNGSAWSTSVPVASVTAFYGISCPSTSLCQATGYRAVGDANTVGVAVAITPTGVTAVDLPGVDYGYTVSCASTRLCLALGQQDTADQNTITQLLVYNGSNWKDLRRAPDDSPTLGCAKGTTWCFGHDYQNGEQFFYSAGRYTPSTAVLPGWVQAINCLGVNNCVVAGDTGRPAVYQFRNGVWSAPRTIDSLHGNTFGALSCPTSTWCAVVPHYVQHG